MLLQLACSQRVASVLAGERVGVYGQLRAHSTGETMEDLRIDGIELMGENVRAKLRSCGADVKIYPMAKIAFPHVVDIGNHAKIRDFAFIFAGEGVSIGEYTDVQPHTVIWGGGKTIIGDRVSTGPGTVFLSATYSHAAGLKMGRTRRG